MEAILLRTSHTNIETSKADRIVLCKKKKKNSFAQTQRHTDQRTERESPQKQSIISLMSLLLDGGGIIHTFSFTHRLSKWCWNSVLAM